MCICIYLPASPKGLKFEPPQNHQKQPWELKFWLKDSPLPNPDSTWLQDVCLCLWAMAKTSQKAGRLPQLCTFREPEFLNDFWPTLGTDTDFWLPQTSTKKKGSPKQKLLGFRVQSWYLSRVYVWDLFAKMLEVPAPFETFTTRSNHKV